MSSETVSCDLAKGGGGGERIRRRRAHGSASVTIRDRGAGRIRRGRRRLEVGVVGECGCEAVRPILAVGGGGGGHALETQLLAERVRLGAAVVGALVALRHRALSDQLYSVHALCSAYSLHYDAEHVVRATST